MQRTSLPGLRRICVPSSEELALISQNIQMILFGTHISGPKKAPKDKPHVLVCDLSKEDIIRMRTRLIFERVHIRRQKFEAARELTEIALNSEYIPAEAAINALFVVLNSGASSVSRIGASAFKTVILRGDDWLKDICIKKLKGLLLIDYLRISPDSPGFFEPNTKIKRELSVIKDLEKTRSLAGKTLMQLLEADEKLGMHIWEIVSTVISSSSSHVEKVGEEMISKAMRSSNISIRETAESINQNGKAKAVVSVI